jgi:hypothetical protein
MEASSEEDHIWKDIVSEQKKKKDKEKVRQVIR